MSNLITDDSDIIPAETLASIRVMVRERTGLIFEGATEYKLKNALLEQVQERSSHAFVAYYQRLNTDIAEFERFVVLLTINETFFYRESAQLTLLTDTLAPMMREKRGELEPVKIMSVGCSTGEEAYSIAMALYEHFGVLASRYFKIVAGDIDKIALQKAKKGEYRPFSFRGVDPRIVEKYFTPVSEYLYAIDPKIKAMVTFDHFNLLAQPDSSLFTDIDVIFYRNVSIYFDKETRQEIIQNLSARLLDHGCLIMSSVEIQSNDFGVLNLTSKGSQFYFSRLVQEEKKESKDRLTELETRVDIEGRSKARLNFSKVHQAIAALQNSISMDLPYTEDKASVNVVSREKLIEFIGQERWKESIRLVGTLKDLSEKDRDQYLALIYMNMRDFDKAYTYCQRLLAENEWSVNAQIILGLIEKYQDNYQAATEYFKRAAYIDSRCWFAQYQLAECLRLLGQAKQALRVYSLALNIIQQLGDEEEEPRGEMILPFNISIQQAKALSSLHINNIKE